MTARSMPAAIRRLLCPRCREGRVFSGPMTMNERCPACGLKFERGPGYFTGAMYFSYAMGIPIIALLTGLGKLLIPSWPLHWLVVLAWVLFLPLVPAVFRYSRVMFLHFDQYYDPVDDAGQPGRAGEKSG